MQKLKRVESKCWKVSEEEVGVTKTKSNKCMDSMSEIRVKRTKRWRKNHRRFTYKLKSLKEQELSKITAKFVIHSVCVMIKPSKFRVRTKALQRAPTSSRNSTKTRFKGTHPRTHTRTGAHTKLHGDVIGIHYDMQWTSLKEVKQLI